MSLQGGDRIYKPEFFRYIVFPLLTNKSTILNLGSGINFYFEKDIKFFFPHTNITSVDIVPIKKIPTFINEFKNLDLEEPFIMNKKFSIITCFEVIEHIVNTDNLLTSCINNLNDEGYFIISFPNLASLFCRIELLLGFQPHVLETSNKLANFGMGIFGKKNNPTNEPIHHIRGITKKAMQEMLNFYGFNIVKTLGSSFNFQKIFSLYPNIAPMVFFICQKKSKLI